MVHIGIIGAGRIGKVHVQSICTKVQGAEVSMLADPFMTEETASWAEQTGVKEVTKDYRDILSSPDIDAVLICSSTDTHAPVSMEAIEAGKHVFCEKPVDLNPANIRKVMDALDRHPDIRYQVGFNRRFDHNFEAVKKAVTDGRVGDVQIIRVTSRDPEPPSPAYVKVSGGIFLDMMIHDFDMVRYLAGCDAVEVYAEAGVLIDKAIGDAGDVDTAIVTLRMANGAIAAIDNSRKAVYGYDQRAEVFGSKGMAANGNDAPSSTVISTVDGVTGEKPLYFFLERYMDAYAKEIGSFVKAIETGTKPDPGIEDGLKAVLMGLAAKKSLQEHRPVRIDEIAY